MKSTIALSALATLIPFITAAPAPATNQIYSLIAIHSGDQRVHQKPIVAASTYLMLGDSVSVTVDCGPDNDKVASCSKNSATAIDFRTDGSAYLSSHEPVPQQVYVTSQGILRYVAAHSDVVPGLGGDGSQAPYTNQFSLEALGSPNSGSTDNARVIFSSEDAGSWLACPSGDNYQVYANLTSSIHPPDNCIGFDMVAEPIDASSADAFSY
ncbi:MAG: hypothetical protein M1838_002726 [Thelocarpon superellum]|nr:MAG: hypothetical protein M1838_002726 [Thelocarpon superellum]